MAYKQQTLFLGTRGWEVQDQGMNRSCLVWAHFLAHSDCLLTLPSHGQSTEREANSLMTSLRSSNHEDSIFMTSCNSNYLINVPALNTIILGIRFQSIDEFWEDTNISVQSTSNDCPSRGTFTHSLAVVAVNICKLEFKPAATGTQWYT